MESGGIIHVVQTSVAVLERLLAAFVVVTTVTTAGASQGESQHPNVTNAHAKDSNTFQGGQRRLVSTGCPDAVASTSPSGVQNASVGTATRIMILTILGADVVDARLSPLRGFALAAMANGRTTRHFGSLKRNADCSGVPLARLSCLWHQRQPFSRCASMTHQEVKVLAPTLFHTDRDLNAVLN